MLPSDERDSTLFLHFSTSQNIEAQSHQALSTQNKDPLTEPRRSLWGRTVSTIFGGGISIEGNGASMNKHPSPMLACSLDGRYRAILQSSCLCVLDESEVISSTLVDADEFVNVVDMCFTPTEELILVLTSEGVIRAYDKNCSIRVTTKNLFPTPDPEIYRCLGLGFHADFSFSSAHPDSLTFHVSYLEGAIATYSWNLRTGLKKYVCHEKSELVIVKECLFLHGKAEALMFGSKSKVMARESTFSSLSIIAYKYSTDGRWQLRHETSINIDFFTVHSVDVNETERLALILYTDGKISLLAMQDDVVNIVVQYLDIHWGHIISATFISDSTIIAFEATQGASDIFELDTMDYSIRRSSIYMLPPPLGNFYPRMFRGKSSCSLSILRCVDRSILQIFSIRIIDRNSLIMSHAFEGNFTSAKYLLSTLNDIEKRKDLLSEIAKIEWTANTRDISVFSLDLKVKALKNLMSQIADLPWISTELIALVNKLKPYLALSPDHVVFEVDSLFSKCFTHLEGFAECNESIIPIYHISNRLHLLKEIVSDRPTYSLSPIAIQADVTTILDDSLLNICLSLAKSGHIRELSYFCIQEIFSIFPYLFRILDSMPISTDPNLYKLLLPSPIVASDTIVNDFDFIQTIFAKSGDSIFRSANLFSMKVHPVAIRQFLITIYSPLNVVTWYMKKFMVLEFFGESTYSQELLAEALQKCDKLEVDIHSIPLFEILRETVMQSKYFCNLLCAKLIDERTEFSVWCNMSLSSRLSLIINKFVEVRFSTNLLIVSDDREDKSSLHHTENSVLSSINLAHNKLQKHPNENSVRSMNYPNLHELLSKYIGPMIFGDNRLFKNTTLSFYRESCLNFKVISINQIPLYRIPMTHDDWNTSRFEDLVLQAILDAAWLYPKSTESLINELASFTSDKIFLEKIGMNESNIHRFILEHFMTMDMKTGDKYKLLISFVKILEEGADSDLVNKLNSVLSLYKILEGYNIELDVYTLISYLNDLNDSMDRLKIHDYVITLKNGYYAFSSFFDHLRFDKSKFLNLPEAIIVQIIMTIQRDSTAWSKLVDDLFIIRSIFRGQISDKWMCSLLLNMTISLEISNYLGFNEMKLHLVSKIGEDVIDASLLDFVILLNVSEIFESSASFSCLPLESIERLLNSLSIDSNVSIDSNGRHEKDVEDSKISETFSKITKSSKEVSITSSPILLTKCNFISSDSLRRETRFYKLLKILLHVGISLEIVPASLRSKTPSEALSILLKQQDGLKLYNALKNGVGQDTLEQDHAFCFLELFENLLFACRFSEDVTVAKLRMWFVLLEYSLDLIDTDVVQSIINLILTFPKEVLLEFKYKLEDLILILMHSTCEDSWKREMLCSFLTIFVEDVLVDKQLHLSHSSYGSEMLYNSLVDQHASPVFMTTEDVRVNNYTLSRLNFVEICSDIFDNVVSDMLYCGLNSSNSTSKLVRDAYLKQFVFDIIFFFELMDESDREKFIIHIEKAHCDLESKLLTIISAESSTSDFVPDESFVAACQKRGYSRNGSLRSVIASNNQGEKAALLWASEHLEDPEFNSPIVVRCGKDIFVNPSKTFQPGIFQVNVAIKFTRDLQIKCRNEFYDRPTEFKDVKTSEVREVLRFDGDSNVTLPVAFDTRQSLSALETDLNRGTELVLPNDIPSVKLEYKTDADEVKFSLNESVIACHLSDLPQISNIEKVLNSDRISPEESLDYENENVDIDEIGRLASLLEVSCEGTLPALFSDILKASIKISSAISVENMTSHLCLVSSSRCHEAFNILMSMIDFFPVDFVRITDNVLSTRFEVIFSNRNTLPELHMLLPLSKTNLREKLKCRFNLLRVKYFLDNLQFSKEDSSKEDSKYFEDIYLRALPYLKNNYFLSLHGVLSLYSGCLGSEIEKLLSIKDLFIQLASSPEMPSVELKLMIDRAKNDIAILKRLQRIPETSGVNGKLLLLSGDDLVLKDNEQSNQEALTNALDEISKWLDDKNIDKFHIALGKYLKMEKSDFYLLLTVAEFSRNCMSLACSGDVDILMISVKKYVEKLSTENFIILVAIVSGIPLDMIEISAFGRQLLNTKLICNIWIEDPQLVLDSIRNLSSLYCVDRDGPGKRVSTTDETRHIRDFVTKSINFMSVLQCIPRSVSLSREVRFLSTQNKSATFVEIISICLCKPEMGQPELKNLQSNLLEYIQTSCDVLDNEITVLFLLINCFSQVIKKRNIISEQINIEVCMEEIFRKAEMLLTLEGQLNTFFEGCADVLFRECSCILSDVDIKISDILLSLQLIEGNLNISCAKFSSLKTLLVTHAIFDQSVDILYHIVHDIACFSSSNFQLKTDSKFIIDVNNPSTLFPLVESCLLNATNSAPSILRLVLSLCRNLQISCYSSYTDFFSGNACNFNDSHIEFWLNILEFCEAQKLIDDMIEIIIYDCDSFGDRGLNPNIREYLTRLSIETHPKYDFVFKVLVGDTSVLTSSLLCDCQVDYFFLFLVLLCLPMHSLVNSEEVYLFLYKQTFNILRSRLEQRDDDFFPIAPAKFIEAPLYCMLREAKMFSIIRKGQVLKRIPYILSPLYLIENALVANQLEVASYLYCDLLRVPKVMFSKCLAQHKVLHDVKSGNLPYYLSKLNEALTGDLGWNAWKNIHL